MPLPKFLDKFSDEDVNGLISAGIITPILDDAIVARFDKDEPTISSSILTFPMTLDVYDDNLVAENFELEFEEFIVEDEIIVSEVTASIEATASQADTEPIGTVAELEQRVTTLSTALDEAQGDQVLINASKDEIIRLRISLGEGTSEADFNTEFPYLPLNDPENNV